MSHTVLISIKNRLFSYFRICCEKSVYLLRTFPFTLSEIRRVIVGFFAICVIGLVFYVVIKEVWFHKIIIIEPFDVPKSISENGYTSGVISKKIIDEVYRFNRELITEYDYEIPDEYIDRESYNKLPDLMIPETKVSIRSLIQFVKAGIAKETLMYINGEIVLEDGQIKGTIRDSRGNSKMVQENEAQLDIFLKNSAQVLL